MGAYELAGELSWSWGVGREGAGGGPGFEGNSRGWEMEIKT